MRKDKAGSPTWTEELNRTGLKENSVRVQNMCAALPGAEPLTCFSSVRFGSGVTVLLPCTPSEGAVWMLVILCVHVLRASLLILHLCWLSGGGVCLAVFYLRRSRCIPPSQCGPLYEERTCTRSVSVPAPVYLSDQISTPKNSAVRLVLAPLIRRVLQARFQSVIHWLLLQVPSTNHAGRDLGSWISLPVTRKDFSSLLQWSVKKTGFPDTTHLFCPQEGPCMASLSAFIFSPHFPPPSFLSPLPSSIYFKLSVSKTTMQVFLGDLS